MWSPPIHPIEVEEGEKGGSRTLAVLLCLALFTWVAAVPTPAVVIAKAELLQSTL